MGHEQTDTVKRVTENPIQHCCTAQLLPTGQASEYPTNASKKESYTYAICLKLLPRFRRSECSKSKRLAKEADETENAHQCSKDCGDEEKPTHKTPPKGAHEHCSRPSKGVNTLKCGDEPVCVRNVVTTLERELTLAR